jgi:hypothetical protein
MRSDSAARAMVPTASTSANVVQNTIRRIIEAPKTKGTVKLGPRDPSTSQ